MAHYAFLDENNIVQSVYVGMNENDLTELPEGVLSWEEHYTNTQGMTCKRTSYNTIGNVHNNEGTPFRGNYAGIGYVYDDVNDIFIPVKPYDSWLLDISTATWKAPVDKPTDGQDYTWNEDTQSWDLVE